MDYLPIQASSVPSERVFSSSSETDTKRRNRIHPVLMEALQMLKFALKKERFNFNFMQGLITPDSVMCALEPEGVDFLARLLNVEEGNSDDLFDRMIVDLAEDEGRTW